MQNRQQLIIGLLMLGCIFSVFNCAKHSPTSSSTPGAVQDKNEKPSTNVATLEKKAEPSEDVADEQAAPELDEREVLPSASPPITNKKMALASQVKEKSIGQYRMHKKKAPKSSQGEVKDQRQQQKFNTETYDHIVENSFLLVKDNPLSTFSIDVDTASYTNTRRFINQGRLPPPDAVRLEEFINYFSYAYPIPKTKTPFSVNVELASSPWHKNHTIARIGLKGREISRDNRSASNLVFLLDVSGSMESPNKLPLLRSAMKMLVNNLNQRDRVAIVVYAGASGLVLPSTPCSQKQSILEALEKLQAGGSTNAGAGIQLAYQTAVANFIKGGINRVLLATDGDFNMGVTNQGDLIRLIEDKAKKGVFLTVLGLGMGNYKDSTLEKLADKGNGNYGYIDTIHEARKMLVEQMGGTLVTIAKDVKIQVEFNPLKVGAYRLIGYENRMLRAEDFTDDKKDAGEIGAGHTVTALYELVPPEHVGAIRQSEKLKYQKPRQIAAETDEWMTVKLRYKKPDADKSVPLNIPVKGTIRNWNEASTDFKFTCAVTEFGMLLRNSQFKGNSSFKQILALAEAGKGKDLGGYRSEFIKLVKTASALKGHD